MAGTDQVVCQQVTLNARSFHIWRVLLSQSNQIMRIYGYYPKPVHFSDANEYWSQYYSHQNTRYAPCQHITLIHLLLAALRIRPTARMWRS
jgi:hypothetical protein